MDVKNPADWSDAGLHQNTHCWYPGKKWGEMVKGGSSSTIKDKLLGMGRVPISPLGSCFTHPSAAVKCWLPSTHRMASSKTCPQMKEASSFLTLRRYLSPGKRGLKPTTDYWGTLTLISYTKERHCNAVYTPVPRGIQVRFQVKSRVFLALLFSRSYPFLLPSTQFSLERWPSINHRLRNIHLGPCLYRTWLTTAEKHFP